MKKFSTLIAAAIRTLGRNALAIILRFVMACCHHDWDEIGRAYMRIVFESVWLSCWFLVALCFSAGFYKPHCFAMSVLFAILSGICRSNADQLYNQWRA